MTNLLLTFYGDDFTGSTDAMEALTFGGVPAALFLTPPQPHHLQGRFPNLAALGIAGASRSMNPAQMERDLRPKFEGLKQLGAPLVHYKTCSTFDSSPEVGSIGLAADIGQSIFHSPFVPMVVGAPVLRRYVAFANLYATVGDETFRLDRHPTMSRHPVTPMNESDLRLHLAKQTRRTVRSFDLLALAGNDEEIDARFRALLAERPDVVLFDTLNDEHLAQIGRLIWRKAQDRPGDRPLFTVGSSGTQYALIRHWQRTGQVSAPTSFPSPGPVDQLIVISGSGSPVTAEQITWAAHNGFTTLRLDAPALLDPSTAEGERNRAVAAALEVLKMGQSVILFSTQGPDDAAIPAAKRRGAELGLEPATVGHRLAEGQGEILRTLLRETGMRRACIAGGDTCSHATPILGIYALEAICPIAPGGPLCRASSEQPHMDGLEISLKGGQVGKADYFGRIREGR
ncbi:MAG: four-carbon acid sugar kinase family protein [Caldilineaceae bacterium]|nr:four-carbon acid sugar kinase family protein [Caldilineaceae bacterium]